MANKKAILGRPLPDATVSRNAFDRSSVRQYHYALGQLVPVWWEPVIAGSHCKLNRKIFQRTADVNTAAFPRMDTHIQYYFVPFRQMWSQWDDFKLNIQDGNSTALASVNDTDSWRGMRPPTRVPYFSWTEYLTELATARQEGATDPLGYSKIPNAILLMNYLGYGQGDQAMTKELNLWPILAYHKIYYDHFRNSAYENNDPFMYNMDYLWSRYGSMQLPQYRLLSGSQTSFQDLCQIHYVNYRNDYYNNIYPALNYVQTLPTGTDWRLPGNIQGLSSAIQAVLSGSTGLDSGRYNVDTSSGQPSGLPEYALTIAGNQNGRLEKAVNVDGSIIQYPANHTHAISGSATIDMNNVLTAQTMRSIFALDKLTRSAAYAPKHAKDQYEARFGIKFPENPNESLFLGSFQNDITIGEVTATANSSINGKVEPTGSIGGKGVSFADWGETIDFNAKEDGIVMAIQYTTVRSNYRALGVDSYLTKHLREDYFQPEFQDLGLEPVVGSEFNGTVSDEIVLGFRPRNQRYKLSIDKSYGLFMDMEQDMSMFVNHTDVGRIPTESGLSAWWFKVRPSDLNGIMRVNYDGNWNTHQFFGETEFGFTCVQNMSVHGQPSL